MSLISSCPDSSQKSNASQSVVTNQNCGDLYPFIEDLVQQLPPSFGILPICTVLDHLKKNAATVFQRIDIFVEAAQRMLNLSDEVATMWKDKGNEEFEQGRYEASINCYTRGLLSAASTEVVTTLLNNRSTSFYKLHRYADSCVDAHSCLKYNPTYWKALQRRGSALKELGLCDQGRKDITAAELEDLSFANSCDELDTLLGESLRGLSECAIQPSAVALSINVDRSAKGRGIFAAKQIDKGTVLEETPYAFVSRLETTFSTCSFCLQHKTCLYSGEKFRLHKRKSRGLFCSDECASAAWQLFREEADNVFFLCCPNDALLAHRLIRAKERFPSITHLKVGSQFNEHTNNEITADYIGILEGSHSRELNEDATLGGRETIVAAIGLYLNAYSSEEAEQMRKSQRQILLSGIDVKCQLQTAKQDSSNNNESPGTLFSTSTVVVGCAIYGIASLFNHSCDPNCFLSFFGNPQSCCAKAVVRVIRPVSTGEELTISYDGLTRFKYHSKAGRIQMLRKRYGFVCQCCACVEDVDEPVPLAERDIYIKASDYYQKGLRLIRERNYTTAVTVLLQSYEIVMRYICPSPRRPLPMIPTIHQSLALAYFHLNNRAKCLEHLLASLEVDVQIHGTDNRVEMIHEYNRLSSVASEVKDREFFCEKAIELLQSFYAPSPMLSLTIAMMRSSATSSRKE